MRRILLSLFLAGISFAQVKVANPGFEAGELGGVPTGWFAPQAAVEAGFAVKLVDQGCFDGARCAMMTGVAKPPADMFGNLMQTLPSGGYTSRRIRLRAAIRVEGKQTRAQMWLRLDRADNTMAFLDNMGRRPVRSSEWKIYNIETNVAEDISRLAFGVILFGGGTAWVDDVGIDILNEVRKGSIEAAGPLTARGLANVTAFAKLYGYVRHFHPSDQAAGTDWDTFAVEGVRGVEAAGSTDELVNSLHELFQPIAPSVQIFPSGRRPPPRKAPTGPQIIRYAHQGVGLDAVAGTFSVYKSERETKPADGQEIPRLFEAELVPGVTASVPLVLYVDSGGTLPYVPPPDSSILYEHSAEDRGTRLAAVVIAWNVFQHFYPYFDVVKADWNAELPKALRAAATDSGPVEFQKTLQRLVAALKDGHGSVCGPNQTPVFQPPLSFAWVQGQFIVTRVGWEIRASSHDEGGKPDADLLRETAEELGDYLLFIDEPKLPSRIQGSSGFSEKFAAMGPRDRRGRSLRQFDLEHRLMRYPCSYMIYTDAFDGLPAEARDAIYRRMWQILSGEEKGQKYQRLSLTDRRAIVDILRETKKDLPTYFVPLTTGRRALAL